MVRNSAKDKTSEKDRPSRLDAHRKDPEVLSRSNYERDKSEEEKEEEQELLQKKAIIYQKKSS